MEPSNKTVEGNEGPERQFNFNTVFGLLFVAFSIILFVIIPDQIEKPLIVFSMNETDLEPSLFPQIVAAGFGGLGIWLFFRSFTISEANKVKVLTRRQIVNVSVTLLAMTIYGPMMMEIGFVVASALVIAFLSTFFGNKNYILTAVVSTTVPIAIFYSFTKLLATYLPPFPIDTVLTRLYIL